jgi:carbamate kinase
MKKTVVLALGGNALTLPGQAGTAEELQANAIAMAVSVRDLLEGGYGIVIVHGNGPQVGNLSYQQEEGAAKVPALPLFMLGSMTQGQIGSLLALAIHNVLGSRVNPVAVVTHVLVDPQDPAFDHPTKPIGPFLDPQGVQQLVAARGWSVVDDAGRGLRRAVPSPEPRGIVELGAIRELVGRGCLVIASGGGGVPVAEADDRLSGVNAVIDKDLAAQRLASDLRADALAMVTGVSHVSLNWGRPNARAIDEMSLAEAQTLADEGHFPAGSMGPKVSAALRFIRGGGKVAVITSPEHVRDAVAGKHGTRIVPAAKGAAVA